MTVALPHDCHANIEYKSQYMTDNVFLRTCMSQDVTICEYLVKNGVDYKAKDRQEDLGAHY